MQFCAMPILNTEQSQPSDRATELEQAYEQPKNKLGLSLTYTLYLVLRFAECRSIALHMLLSTEDEKELDADYMSCYNFTKL